MRRCETCRAEFLPSRRKQRFCGRSCSTKSYAPKPIPIADRFWQHVDRSARKDGCWLWTGAQHNGYGRVSFNRRSALAHRVSYFLVRGEWPTKFALHLCDNPPCVNPEHLLDGDQAENMRQCAERGRTRKPMTKTGETHGL